MNITPDFATIAEQWLKHARALETDGPSHPRELLQHEAWGRLLINHGWLTKDGTQATGQGTVAPPAEVLAIWREEYEVGDI